MNFLAMLGYYYYLLVISLKDYYVAYSDIVSYVMSVADYHNDCSNIPSCHPINPYPFTETYSPPISSRFWTRGYDVYTPNRILVAHDSKGSMNKDAPVMSKKGDSDPKSWARNGMTPFYRRDQYQKSIKRINALFGYHETGSHNVL